MPDYHEKLQPLSERTYPKIIAVLEELRQEYIPNIPKAHLRYVWKPISLGHPFIFGRLRRYYLFIPAEYVLLFEHDPNAFRTVIRHELSHLYNRDVDKTYFTIVIWYVFCVIALLPYIIFSLSIFWLYPVAGTDFATNGILRVIAMGLVVYLVRAAVLRSRELSADAQAAEWGNSSELHQQIETLDPGKGIFSFYPTHEKRRHNVDEPGEIFALKMLPLFRCKIGISLSSISCPGCSCLWSGYATFVSGLHSLPLYGWKLWANGGYDASPG